MVIRVSVTPKVLENVIKIEPVSLRAYFRNLDELNDDFQAVIKQLRTAAEPSSADLRQYEELCLKQGFNKFVARSACETARQGFLLIRRGAALAGGSFCFDNACKTVANRIFGVL